MRVYVLRLERARNLQWAFNVIANADYVVSSTFEAQPCQVRFVAPRHQADALVERIYLDGGLVWGARHDLKLPHASDCARRKSAVGAALQKGRKGGGPASSRRTAPSIRLPKADKPPSVQSKARLGAADEY